MGDFADDAYNMAIDEEVFNSIRSDREKLWKQGLHITEGGNTIKICDMKTSHIINTIKYFSVIDINNNLYIELRKRGNTFDLGIEKQKYLKAVEDVKLYDAENELPF